MAASSKFVTVDGARMLRPESAYRARTIYRVVTGNTVFVDGMDGMGDSVYQRPFVRDIAKRATTYVATSWPEIYQDLGVSFVTHYTGVRYRTQSKNVGRTRFRIEPGVRARRVHLWYGRWTSQGMSILEDFEQQCPIEGEFRFDLPDGPSRGGPKYALVRPNSVRAEWMAPARNPRPRHVEQACRELRSRGIRVILVADLEEGREWLDHEVVPEHDEAYLKGELDLEGLMAAVRGAEIVVGGPSWIIPFSLAAKTPLLVLAGGCGGINSPEVLMDRRLDTSRVRWVMPDRFCRCSDYMHDCDKKVLGYEKVIATAIDEVLR